MKRNLIRAIVAGLMLLVAVSLVSTTLGRDLLAGRQPTLGSFSLIHFAGYLFFLVMPVEVLVPYYLAEGYPGMTLVVIAVPTAIAAQLIDFGIGYLLSSSIIDKVIGRRKYQRAERAIHRYGPGAIFAFNLLPLSSPTLLLAAGMVRFPLKRAVLFSAIGLSLKYVVIVSAFTWWG